MFISTMAVQFSPTNCMRFINETNRNQTFFSTPDDQIMADNPVRSTDASKSKASLKKTSNNHDSKQSFKRSFWSWQKTNLRSTNYQFIYLDIPIVSIASHLRFDQTPKSICTK